MGGEGGRDTQKTLVNTLDAQKDPDGWRLFVFGLESLQSLHFSAVAAANRVPVLKLRVRQSERDWRRSRGAMV